MLTEKEVIKQLLEIAEEALWWADEGNNDQNMSVKYLRHKFAKLKQHIEQSGNSANKI